MTIEIHFARHVVPVKVPASAAAPLAAKIASAAPGTLTPRQRKALRETARAAAGVQSVLDERDRTGPSRVRPVRSACINYWSALHEALGAAARVAGIDARGARAAEIALSLFPFGLEFTQLEGELLWSESKRRIERMEAEGLGEEIASIVGRTYVDAVKAGTAALAEAVGVGRTPRTVPSSTALAEALARFGRKVAAYGRAMAADVDVDDPASVARFLAAMAPIEAVRATRTAAAPEPASPPEPAPTPADPVA